jgi:hypothetical protein
MKMKEWHPTDVELARLSGKGTASGNLEHIHSCTRCRSVMADYDWLQGELAETLKSVANEVPVPQAAWSEMQDRLLERKHCQVVRIQVSAVTSAVMVLCLLLWAPGFMKPTAAAQTVPPEVLMRPTPIVATELAGPGERSWSSGASSMLTASRSDARLSPAPALAPSPASPDLESWAIDGDR